MGAQLTRSGVFRGRVSCDAEEAPVIQRARCHAPLAFAAALSIGLGATLARASETCVPRNEIESTSSMRLRADGCALSLADTTAALDALLTEAWDGKRMPVERASLSLGRVVDYPWLSKALADAATLSPVWEPNKGRGRRSSDNEAVASMVDTRRLLMPLASTFARHGATARAGSVEKVLVGKVGDAQELASLAGQKLADGKKLPFDAILWLRLERIPEE
jgi:hypothetical protein